MTNERIKAIAEALGADDEQRKALLAMEPAAAAAALKDKGYDFTEEELVEFGKLVVEATESGELDADKLDEVAGGSVTVGVLLGVTFATKVAYDVGKAIGGRYW